LNLHKGARQVDPERVLDGAGENPDALFQVGRLRSFTGRTVLAHPPVVPNQMLTSVRHMLKQRLQPFRARHHLQHFLAA